jgi:hypothetical protein
MNRRTISLFIVIFAASICAGWFFVSQDSTAKLDVCEAAFRSLWTPDTFDSLRTETFFLGTGSMRDPKAPWDEDFPNEFYGRFSDIGIQFHKRSDFQVSEKNWLWFCESPKRIDGSTFEVGSGHWCGNLCFSRCLHTLRQKNGRWVVEKSEDCYVS